MIFHDSVPSYAQPTSIGTRQYLARRNGWSLPGGSLLWKTAGKVAGVVCLVAIVLHLIMGEYIQTLDQATRVAESSRHALADTNISIRAQRAALLTPEQVELIAGNALSLYVPTKGQVNVYNRGKDRFEHL